MAHVYAYSVQYSLLYVKGTLPNPFSPKGPSGRGAPGGFRPPHLPWRKDVERPHAPRARARAPLSQRARRGVGSRVRARVALGAGAPARVSIPGRRAPGDAHRGCVPRGTPWHGAERRTLSTVHFPCIFPCNFPCIFHYSVHNYLRSYERCLGGRGEVGGARTSPDRVRSPRKATAHRIGEAPRDPQSQPWPTRKAATAPQEVAI